VGETTRAKLLGAKRPGRETTRNPVTKCERLQIKLTVIIIKQTFLFDTF